MNKSVLVIGSNSFSGSNFVKSLLSEKYSVTGVSRQQEISHPFKPYDGENENFEFFQLNVNSDYKKIVKICIDKNINTVVNFAAQSMVAESWNTPWDWYHTNITSLSLLLSEINKMDLKIKKFINFTTPEVYGSTKEWIKESFNFNPNTPYAISRAAGDYHLKALHDSFRFPVIFTRAANVFGEYQPPYRLIPKALIFGLSGKKIPLHGGGLSERSFIHIDDVSTALIKIIESGVAGSTYHISTNRIEKIVDILKICANELNTSVESLCEFTDDRVGKDFAYKLDTEKIRSELGWKDQISLEEGISRTFDWIKSNFDDIISGQQVYIHRK